MYEYCTYLLYVKISFILRYIIMSFFRKKRFCIEISFRFENNLFKQSYETMYYILINICPCIIHNNFLGWNKTCNNCRILPWPCLGNAFGVSLIFSLFLFWTVGMNTTKVNETDVGGIDVLIIILWCFSGILLASFILMFFVCLLVWLFFCLFED